MKRSTHIALGAIACWLCVVAPSQPVSAQLTTAKSFWEAFTRAVAPQTNTSERPSADRSLPNESRPAAGPSPSAEPSLSVGTSLSTSASAEASASGDAWDFQFDLFQLLLEEQGLIAARDLEAALEAPRESVIVLAGVIQKDLLPWEKIGRFLEDGGVVLLAVDTDRNMKLPEIGRFSIGPVTADDPRIRYSVFPDCVQVTEITNVQSQFGGVFNIVTNRSAWFLPESQGPFVWEAIARFPRGCLPGPSQGKPLLAIGRPVAGGQGFLLVSADGSLLTNGMLWHGDNAVLAIRIASLLAGNGQRKSRLVFIGDGESLGAARDRLPPKPPHADENNQPKIKVPEPQLSQVLKVANAVVKEVVDSNVLNETLKQQPRNVSPSRYFRALLILLALALSLWALARLWFSGTLRPIHLRRRKMRSAYELQAVSGEAVSGDAAGDYRQSAGYLAREFCRELTGSRSSADWQKYAGQVLSSTSSVPGADRHELVRIVDIASRGHRARMSGADFQQLGKTIAALRIKYSQA